MVEAEHQEQKRPNQSIAVGDVAAVEEASVTKLVVVKAVGPYHGYSK